MKEKYNELIDEALRTEKNMQELYGLFQKYFTEDAAFWKAIADEEETHWSLINLGKDILTPKMMEGIFVYDDLDELKEVNDLVRDYIEHIEKNVPEKEKAYNVALDLEKRSYEFYFQKKIKARPDSRQMEIFQKLNNGCYDHAARIEELLKKKSH